MNMPGEYPSKRKSTRLSDGRKSIKAGKAQRVRVLPTPREPTMADIGILASPDPVALDQACEYKLVKLDDSSGSN